MKTNQILNQKMDDFKDHADRIMTFNYSKLPNNIFDNTEEYFVKKSHHFFIFCNENIDGTNTSDNSYIFELLNICFKKYIDLELFKIYPNIYLKKDNLISHYNFYLSTDLDFIPTVEYADCKETYLKFNENDFIDVIVNSSFVRKTNLLNQSIQIANTQQYFLQNTYLMIDGNGYYKIGKSFNPEIREKTLQSQNPTIELIAFLNKDIEKELHLEYKNKRKRGEWFSLSKEDVKFIIKKYNFQKVKQSA